MKRDILGLSDKAFYRKVFAVCLPIMLQQLLSTAMYMVDTIMIGGLGDIELAGVGAANQLAYLLDICLFGVTGGGSVFMAQYFGKKDLAGVRRTLGLCIVLAGACAALFVAVAQGFGGFCVGLFSDEAAVTARGVEYLTIASWGYLFKALIYPFGAVHKSTGHAKLPMLSGLAGLLVNMFLNYCLIFGNLGFPMLGVRGAAIATLIGSAVDCGTLLFFSFARDTAARAKWHELFDHVFANIRPFVAVSAPVLLDDSIWALGMLAQNAIYGKMGTDAFAAMMIVGTVDKLSFILLQGIGTAAAVVIGNTLGASGQDDAYVYGKRFLWLSALVGTLVAVLVCTLGVYIPYLYTNTTPATQALAADTTFVMGFALPLWALNFTIIVGILRSGGDTRAAAIIDLLPMWAISIPLSLLVGLYFKLPLPYVYACQHVASLVRLFFALRRTNQGKWARQLV
jgi:MATE efflux family protein